jgi:5-methylthioadenosine/S-adenosylhomocysteine deaminase
MNQCGIFDVPTIAAHCVFVDEHDMDLLAEKNVSVSHCPVSNLKLGSGVAPVSKMLEKGINVAIGTDGVASNNNTNFFEELKLAPILQKGYFHDPLLVSTTQTLQMATRNGAKAQGRQESGVLKVGNRADLIMIDLDKPHLTPAHDIISNLIYSAVPSDIVMTIVDGKVLYKNNEYLTIDIEKVKYETKKSTDEILSRINSKI